MTPRFAVRKSQRGRRVSPTALGACSSSTLAGDLRTSAPGAYLPAVSPIGNPCTSARQARWPPNRRDGQAIAASGSMVNDGGHCRNVEGGPHIFLCPLSPVSTGRSS